MCSLRVAFGISNSAGADQLRQDIRYVHLRSPDAMDRVRAELQNSNVLLFFNGVYSALTPEASRILWENSRRYHCGQAILWHECAVVLREAFGQEGQRFAGRLGRRLAWWWARRFLVNARTAHLCVSRQTKQLVMCILGVPAERAFVCYNTIPLDRYPVRERNVTGPSLRVCMAGDPNWRKGFDLFLSLAERLREVDGRAIEYTWYGGTPEWLEQIRGDQRGRRAEAAGVKLAGFVPLNEALPQEDVLVLTSRSDGFGLVALEALACDRPAFCFDGAGISEGLPPEFVALDLDDLVVKLRAFVRRAAVYPAGYFRSLAEQFSKQRFLSAWRAMEKTLGFREGLPEG